VNKSEELTHWINTYDRLKNELKAAFRFHNRKMIDDLSKRLIVTQRMIAETVCELKKDGNADTGNAVGSAVSPSVNIAKNSPLYLNCPHGLPRGD
jgi:hypothetical protein